MIKILHLYYDILNLYGEQGNIKALSYLLDKQNIEYQIDYLTIDDKIKINDYDFIYMGSGSDNSLLTCLEDIKKYKKELKKYIENKKCLLATGNSYLLFGEKINNLEALNIFSYYSKSSKRISSECLVEYRGLNDIIGFQNRSFISNINKNHLFKVKYGICDNLKSSNEGYHEYGFYGTSIIGPILIRNPHFTNMLLKEICKAKNIEYKDVEDELLTKPYDEFIKNFYKE